MGWSKVNKRYILETFHRDNYTCQGCKQSSVSATEVDAHHCFFRSQYFGKDRHEPWNLVTLCNSCHYSIHHQGNRTLELKLKNIAYKQASTDTQKKLRFGFIPDRKYVSKKTNRK